METPKTSRTIGQLAFCHTATQYLQDSCKIRVEKNLDEHQPTEQAGFQKGYSTSDHLQALNQIIEKSNEYNLLLSIGFTDCHKAFDTVEHFAICEALRKANINETYTKKSYKASTAKLQQGST